MSDRRDRLPELDALRGIAALTVVLYHARRAIPDVGGLTAYVIGALPTHPIVAGRIPVIFFFVLSGYVLTRALMHQPEPINGWVFAARRAIRLCLPAGAALLISSVLYAGFAVESWPGETEGLRAAGWWCPPGFTAFARETLLFGSNADFSMDRALWSLVHELRLSILLPLVVAMPRFRGLDGSILLILSAFAMHALSVAGHTEIENNIMLGPDLPTTIWATAYFSLPFATGSAMALGGWDRWRPAPKDRGIALVAAFLLLCSDNDWASVAASSLLILAARREGAFQSFLRHPVLVWLGQISFSLYLIHLPILLALAHGLHPKLSPGSVACLAVAASLPAAWVMNRLVERPARMLANRIGAAAGMLRPVV
jgi:peptidoglycan/LPS O-acetylase OafA/YrhL